MESLDGKSSADSSQCVRVAVNIRPLITSELMVGCTDCITVVPGEPQVLVRFLLDIMLITLELECLASVYLFLSYVRAPDAMFELVGDFLLCSIE